MLFLCVLCCCCCCCCCCFFFFFFFVFFFFFFGEVCFGVLEDLLDYSNVPAEAGLVGVPHGACLPEGQARGPRLGRRDLNVHRCELLDTPLDPRIKRNLPALLGVLPPQLLGAALRVVLLSSGGGGGGGGCGNGVAVVIGGSGSSSSSGLVDLPVERGQAEDDSGGVRDGEQIPNEEVPQHIAGQRVPAAHSIDAADGKDARAVLLDHIEDHLRVLPDVPLLAPLQHGRGHDEAAPGTALAPEVRASGEGRVELHPDLVLGLLHREHHSPRHPDGDLHGRGNDGVDLVVYGSDARTPRERLDAPDAISAVEDVPLGAAAAADIHVARHRQDVVCVQAEELGVVVLGDGHRNGLQAVLGGRRPVHHQRLRHCLEPLHLGADVRLRHVQVRVAQQQLLRVGVQAVPDAPGLQRLVVVLGLHHTLPDVLHPPVNVAPLGLRLGVHHSWIRSDPLKAVVLGSTKHPVEAPLLLFLFFFFFLFLFLLLFFLCLLCFFRLFVFVFVVVVFAPSLFFFSSFSFSFFFFTAAFKVYVERYLFVYTNPFKRLCVRANRLLLLLHLAC